MKTTGKSHIRWASSTRLWFLWRSYINVSQTKMTFSSNVENGLLPAGSAKVISWIIGRVASLKRAVCVQTAENVHWNILMSVYRSVADCTTRPSRLAPCSTPSVYGRRRRCRGRKFSPRISPLSKHVSPAVSPRSQQLFPQIHSAFIASIVARRSIMQWSANKLQSCRMGHFVVQIDIGLCIHDRYLCIWIGAT